MRKSYEYRMFYEGDIKQLVKDWTDTFLDNENLKKSELYKTLQAIIAKGHLTEKHSSSDINKLLDRLVERPPTYKEQSFSTFGGTITPEFFLSEIISANAEKIIRRLQSDNVRNGDDIVLSGDFGETIGFGIVYEDKRIKIKSTDNFVAVFSVDMEDNGSNYFIKLKTAYPLIDRDSPEINIDTERQTADDITESFYKKLLESSDSKLKATWALIMNGYDIHVVKNFFSEARNENDKWDKHLISIYISENSFFAKESKKYNLSFSSKGKIYCSLYDKESNSWNRIETTQLSEGIKRRIRAAYSIYFNPNKVFEKELQRLREDRTDYLNNKKPIQSHDIFDNEPEL